MAYLPILLGLLMLLEAHEEQLAEPEEDPQKESMENL